jgi:hypothetical protein
LLIDKPADGVMDEPALLACDFNPLDSIATVKKAITRRTAIKPGRQSLFYRSESGRDDQTLASLGIRAGSTLRLMLGGRPSPGEPSFGDAQIYIKSCVDLHHQGILTV